MPTQTISKSLFSFLLMVVFSLVVTGCATTERGEMAKAEFVDKQTERLIKLQKKVENQESEIKLLEQRLASLKAGAPQTTTEPTAQEIDQSGQPPQASSYPPALFPLVDVPSVPTSSQSPEALLNPSSLPSAEERKETVATSLHEAMHFYYLGLESLKEKNYQKSLQSFRKFLEMSPDHVYADRATYWMAENYFRNKEYTLCLSRTQQFAAKFPYSLKIAEVLFQRGVAFAELGDKAEARQNFEQLVREYPHRSIAEQAGKLLASL